MKDYGNHVALILNTAKKEVVNLANEAYKAGYQDRAGDLDKAEDDGYKLGYAEARAEFYDNRYQAGLFDAWIMARKIVCDGVGDYTSKQRREIFGNGSAFAVLKHFTVFDAKKKIEDYEEIKAAQEAAKIIEDEEKQVNELEEIIADLEARHKDDCEDSHEIRVGDVITWKGNEERNYTMLVVKKYTQHGSGKCAVVTSLGDYIDCVKLDDIRKIRHIDDLEPVFGKR